MVKTCLFKERKMPSLGRNKSAFDARDFNLRLFIPRMTTGITESFWEFMGDPLDQKDQPHCGGFSIANFGICLPINSPYTNSDGDAFYYRCKEVDLQPRMENGTSIRSVAKVMKSLGMVEAYAFAPDMLTMDWWILNKGPVIVGTEWTEDMFVPDKDNIIHCTGRASGGHAYIINGKKPGYKHIQNSWGDWGKGGGAWISDEDFEKLFMYNGEVLTSVETKMVDPTKPGSGCSNTKLGKILRKMIK